MSAAERPSELSVTLDCLTRPGSFEPGIITTNEILQYLTALGRKKNLDPAAKMPFLSPFAHKKDGKNLARKYTEAT
jgi:hypothetical protein